MTSSDSECEQACLSNCSCTAFISMNIDGKATRCLVWYSELMDILGDTNERWDLNIHVDATQLGSLLCYLEFAFLNFHYFTFGIFDSLLFYFFFFSNLHKEVQTFTWPQEAAGYYYITCCCAIVCGILHSLYVSNEEEENKKVTKLLALYC